MRVSWPFDSAGALSAFGHLESIVPAQVLALGARGCAGVWIVSIADSHFLPRVRDGNFKGVGTPRRTVRCRNIKLIMPGCFLASVLCYSVTNERAAAVYR